MKITRRPPLSRSASHSTPTALAVGLDDPQGVAGRLQAIGQDRGVVLLRLLARELGRLAALRLDAERVAHDRVLHEGRQLVGAHRPQAHGGTGVGHDSDYGARYPSRRDPRAARTARPRRARRGRALPLAHARHHGQPAAGGAAIGRARASAIPASRHTWLAGAEQETPAWSRRSRATPVGAAWFRLYRRGPPRLRLRGCADSRDQHRSRGGLAWTRRGSRPAGGAGCHGSGDGHAALSLSVDARNAPALALYRSMGFVETEGGNAENPTMLLRLVG